MMKSMKSTGKSSREGSEAIVKLRNKFCALVVDDNQVSRKVLMTTLSWAKIKAQVVENGKGANNLFASGANFHVIFIDMDKPTMDNLQTTRILRSMGVHARIVGVIGNFTECDKAKFLGAGLNEFLVKPLSRIKVVEILHHVDADIGIN